MTPAAKLLAWYDHHGRDLPWRKTRDAYRILVSEVMLQQTQVSRVKEYYTRWLKQFPNWKTLAQANNETIIRAWSGLGYNRRGLMLRDIAQTIAKNGEPKTEEEWQTLKGIGPYTAAALAIFSLHQRTLPIDTNIRRVGARLWLGIPFPELKDDEAIGKAAAHFLPTRGRFYDIPQALFDLASLICTKTPACAACPMLSACKTGKKFITGKIVIPKQSIKKTQETKHRNKPYPDRIYRGRILKAIQTHSSLNIKKLGTLIDPSFDKARDQDWLLRMLDRLQKDRMIDQKNQIIRLHKN